MSARFCVAVGGSAVEVVHGHTLALAEAWNGRDWQIMDAPAVEGSLSGVSCVTASACVAVGGSLAEQWNGRGWQVSRTAVEQLTSVSCVSESFCLALGEHLSDSDRGETYAIGWNGKRWHVLPQVPGDSKDHPVTLSAVSCVTSTMCIAGGTGPLINFIKTSTVADEWNGREWSALPAPAILGLVESYFSSLSCLSATHCVLTAVTYLTGKRAQVWNGSTWRAVSVANPANNVAGFDQLYGVSCTAVSACMAVGIFDEDGLGLAYLDLDISSRTLAEQWGGEHWHVSRTPSPGDKSTGLAGISCRTAAACVAIGSYISGSDADLDLGESWNGRTWRYQTAPSPGRPINDLAAVSCPRASLCVAVGGYSTVRTGTATALAESWNGSTWLPAAIPSPGNANDLSAIACPSASDCIAVGSHQMWRVIPPRPLAEQWNGQSWTLLTTPKPPDGNWAQFTGISCASASDCVAVGGYHDGTLREQPFAEQWNGRTWTVLQVPDVGTAKFTAVDCPAASYCVAVGFHSVQGGTVPARPLAEVWNGISWQAQRIPSTTGIDTGLHGYPAPPPPGAWPSADTSPPTATAGRSRWPTSGPRRAGGRSRSPAPARTTASFTAFPAARRPGAWPPEPRQRRRP